MGLTPEGSPLGRHGGYLGAGRGRNRLLSCPHPVGPGALVPPRLAFLGGWPRGGGEAGGGQEAVSAGGLGLGWVGHLRSRRLVTGPQTLFKLPR